MLIRHALDPWIIDVLDAMRLHLQREGQGGEAIAYGVAHRLARIKLYKEWRYEAEKDLSVPFKGLGTETLSHTARANKQNEIDSSDTWLRELTEPTEVKKLAASLCKKGGVAHRTDDLAKHIGDLITQNIGPLRFLQIEGMLP